MDQNRSMEALILDYTTKKQISKNKCIEIKTNMEHLNSITVIIPRRINNQLAYSICLFLLFVH